MLDSLIDFLTTPHGRRNLYGWVYLAGFVVSIIGILEAKELVQRKTRHKELGCAALDASQILSAQATVDRDGQTETVSATLHQEGTRYVLNLSRSSTSPASGLDSVIERAFDSWHEVAAYLEHNSVLRIGDFKPMQPEHSTTEAAK